MSVRPAGETLVGRRLNGRTTVVSRQDVDMRNCSAFPGYRLSFSGHGQYVSIGDNGGVGAEQG
jgi:hypothetical protein